jgi:hypothetical protein
MTKTIVKSLLAIIIAVVPLTSCSSDEPAASKMSGEEFVKHLDTVLTGLSGQMLYADESETSFYLLTPEKADAYDVCEQLTNEQWEGTDKTFNAPDNYGHIRITNGTVEGLHCTIAFNVNGLKKFTLQLCTYEYSENNNNSEKYPANDGYYCPSCRKKIRPVYNKEKKCRVCPECGRSRIAMLIKWV